MRRREFIPLAASSLVMSGAKSLGQEGGVPKRTIGVLYPGSNDDPVAVQRLQTFQSQLRVLGWQLAENLHLVVEFASGDPASMRSAAKRLLGAKPDVIFVNGTIAAQAARASTTSIPIVFVSAADPVGSGLVQSLARPGGNLTGFANVEFSIGAKWLELLLQLNPQLETAAILTIPGNNASQGIIDAAIEAGRSRRVEVTSYSASSMDEIEHRIGSLRPSHAQGLIVTNAALFAEVRRQVVRIAGTLKGPVVFPDRIYTEVGGLVSLGPDTSELYRDGAIYVDRVLKGARPDVLPVQVPRRLHLVLNLRTAQDKGYSIADELLARADEVIE